MTDLIAGVILAVILAAAGWYVYKAKKSGKACIGCPEGGSCSAKGGCGSCHGCGGCQGCSASTSHPHT